MLVIRRRPGTLTIPNSTSAVSIDLTMEELPHISLELLHSRAPRLKKRDPATMFLQIMHFTDRYGGYFEQDEDGSWRFVRVENNAWRCLR